MSDTKAKKLPKSLTEISGKQCRVVWEIDVRSGHGEWHHIADKPMLDDLVNSMNTQYGEGTHWTETQ